MTGMVVTTNFRALRPSGQTYGLFRATSAVFWAKLVFLVNKYVVMFDVAKQKEEGEL
jgi:hypothetical protein